MWSRLVAAARERRPDALVVIDFADFDFRLARRVKTLGVPVIYYISPQIWAWRPGRIETIREIADRVLVIFPFEEEIYRTAGVPVEFVGHPLIDLARSVMPRESVPRVVGSQAHGADDRDSSGQSSERGQAHSSGPARCGTADSRARARRAMCRRSRAAPRRSSCPRPPVGRACRQWRSSRRSGRRARLGRRRADGVRDGDGPGGAPRYADGRRLPPAGARISDWAPIRELSTSTRW